MNALPEHRRAVHGRTFPSPYRHAAFDPIEHHRAAGDRAWRVAQWCVLAIGIVALTGAFFGVL